MKNRISVLALSLTALLLSACGGAVAPIVSTPIENIDEIPLKVQDLTREERKAWWRMDLVNDTVPGMSVDRAYELIGKRKGKTVVVGVIDSGIDTGHEALKDVVWTNPGEVPGNGIDDDGNGYVDDIHGWNFLGDITAENTEYVRIMKRLEPLYEGKIRDDISSGSLAEYDLYYLAKAEYLEEKSEVLDIKNQLETMAGFIVPAHEAVSEALGKEDYTWEELKGLDDGFLQEKMMLEQMFSYKDNIPDIIEEIEEGQEYCEDRLKNHFDLETDFRAVLGDDPFDISDTGHGNPRVSGPDPDDAEHGTHVAGIIAGRWHEGGIRGVADDNVRIMAIRAVPDGDEYDKDIALAIRYAVDNGAWVINTSFGKYYATNPEWVYDAIEYAAAHDVLIVNAVGNDGLDLDDPGLQVYPNDQTDNETEIADNFLSVGALHYRYGSEMVAEFSNYGRYNTDVFAPGVDMWSAIPGDRYRFHQGTSMAAPAVTGVAAMLRSYYPQLTAAQIKQVIIDSGLAPKTQVIVGGDTAYVRPFSDICTSGRIVNMYNALILADKLVRE